MTEFKPGLEGVVAFETEIAEPDRDGGALRYRGVDIEELVGSVPFEQVWGLLVDESPEPGLPPPEPTTPRATSRGRRPSDLQTVTARLGGEWGLQKLIDISDDEAKEDLRRLSATMISVCAQSARLADGTTDRVDPAVVARGRDDRGAVPARVARARQTRRTSRRSTRTGSAPRSTASTPRPSRRGSSLRPGPTARAALSSAVGALSGPLHGGAPARVLPMLDAAAAAPSVEGFVKDLLDRGDRLMGFGHRVYRAEDPRARLLRGTAQELGVAALRGRGRARARGARGAPRAQARPRARDERRVLVGGRPRRRRRPAAARAGDVRVLAHRGLVGAHPRAEAPEPARAAVRAVRRAGARGRSRRSDGARGGSGARRRARPRARQRDGARDPARAVGRRARGGGAERRLPRPRPGVPRDRTVPLPAEARAHPARARGRERRGARLGPDRAHRALGRPSGRRQRIPGARSTSSRCAIRTRPSAAWRWPAFATARPTAARIQLLEGIAADDETDREVRETARSVAAALVKKARAK